MARPQYRPAVVLLQCGAQKEPPSGMGWTRIDIQEGQGTGADTHSFKKSFCGRCGWSPQRRPAFPPARALCEAHLTQRACNLTPKGN
ncbi:hypothetical protein E2C01_047185 [Portunus trituberculatus]|uniref:Uncharacterized protein n=1 Tax=Portunus trituberculatus TaxID=210409 RepID=A0A5B7G729_PORTR|nr:hypothetical protein [Portunus trituberculatus]